MTRCSTAADVYLEKTACLSSAAVAVTDPLSYEDAVSPWSIRTLDNCSGRLLYLAHQ